MLLLKRPLFNWLQGAPIIARIRQVIDQKGHCHVLEIGAGKSGFASAIEDIRSQVTWTAQDVTRFNIDHLEAVADRVFIGDMDELQTKFDIIFSFYVFEHLTRPEQNLIKLLDCLHPQGRLFLYCPRYDMPFYLSHSCDHYGPSLKFKIGLFLFYLRIKTLLLRKPVYLIHLDPALFRLPFSIDRDAVHWVSQFSLILTAKKFGSVRRLRYKTSGLSEWIGKHFLKVAIGDFQNSDWIPGGSRSNHPISHYL